MFTHNFFNAVTPLAELKMESSFIVSVVVTGLVVVFAALLILVLCISLFGKLFSFFNKPKKPKELKKDLKAEVKKDEVLTKSSVNQEETNDDEIIAVIAAAIAEISNSSGKPLAIRSIKQVGSKVNMWSRAGTLENTRPF